MDTVRKDLRYVARCSRYPEPFTEDDLTELLVLIYKYQTGKLDDRCRELLREKLMHYLCWGADLLERWLAVHGAFDYQSFLDEFLSKDGGGGLLLHNIGKVAEEASTAVWEAEPGEGLSELEAFTVYDLSQAGFDVYTTLGEIMVDGLRPLYERFHQLIGEGDTAKEIYRVYRRVVNTIVGPSTLRDMILAADALTYVQHNYGSVLYDYGGIDVEETREEAERILEGGE